MTAYFDDPDQHPQPDEPLPLVRFLAEHRHFVYRAAVVGETVTQVVHRAGGWIFDQTALGCHVTVVTKDTRGADALKVLGARSVSIDEAVRCGDQPRPHILMASTALCKRALGVRRAVADIIESDDTTVYLFGDEVSATLNPSIRCVEHKLSVATLAFKAQALRLLGVDSSETSEVFGRAIDTMASTFDSSKVRSIRTPAR
ncbi:hypothetical protein [Mycobacterium sp. EPa45]|uniref:hypothetical protein n=1 Tax=Mycobacterium sp. EPa45 TaxID=1545728 RepID=UPI00069CA53C|nr:hypothetical protein [Mycobacterium sp. EPa45]